ncbi:MAG: hypothetical protein Kow0031_10900 [Anaerolineae bacterium]
MPDNYISADEPRPLVIADQPGSITSGRRTIFAIGGERFLFTQSPDDPPQRLLSWTPLGWQEITHWPANMALTDADLHQFINKWQAGGEVTR